MEASELPSLRDLDPHLASDAPNPALPLVAMHQAENQLEDRVVAGGFERAATYLGLVRRPGEPTSVFTAREQRRMLVSLAASVVLLALGVVLGRAGRGVVGAASTTLGLIIIVSSSVWAQRLRSRRRQARGDDQRPR